MGPFPKERNEYFAPTHSYIGTTWFLVVTTYYFLHTTCEGSLHSFSTWFMFLLDHNCVHVPCEHVLKTFGGSFKSLAPLSWLGIWDHPQLQIIAPFYCVAKRCRCDLTNEVDPQVPFDERIKDTIPSPKRTWHHHRENPWKSTCRPFWKGARFTLGNVILCLLGHAEVHVHPTSLFGNLWKLWRRGVCASSTFSEKRPDSPWRTVWHHVWTGRPRVVSPHLWGMALRPRKSLMADQWQLLSGITRWFWVSESHPKRFQVFSSWHL